jgi:hypothetical protein
MGLGVLHKELDLNQAVDAFWFYFGYSGLFTLHDENGWSYERAEHWLCGEASRAGGEASRALLRDRTPH